MPEILDVVQSAYNDLSAAEGAAAPDVPVPETPVTPEAVAAPVPETPVVPAATPDGSAAPVVPLADPAAAEEAELATLEKDLVSKTPGLAKGKITTARHQAVVTKMRTKLEAERDGFKTKAEQFDDPVVQRRLQGATWAETHPEVFLREVVMKHPDYKEAFDAVVAEAVAKASAAPVAPTPPSTPAPAALTRPEPDQVYPDGSLGYSVAAQQQLAQYEAEQRTAPLLAEIKALREGLAPMTAERQAREKTREIEGRVQTRLQAAASWEGFLTHKAAILAELNKPGNERLSLEDAYRVVVIPALKGDRAALEREIETRLVAQLNAGGAPPRRTPGNGAAPAIVADPNLPRDTEDIIREALRGLPA